MATENRILVLGDLMLDCRIEGQMTRISPEAPSPIVRIRSNWQGPGGAGNLAANLAALYDPAHSRTCPRVQVISVLGKDQAGRELVDVLGNNGCSITPAYSDAGTTIVKTRITCGGQQILRIDSEDPCLSNESETIRILSEMLHGQSNICAVVVADYGKGTLTTGTIQHIKDACERMRLPLFVDAKPTTNIALYENASLFKCNLHEAIQLANGHAPPFLYPAPARDVVNSGIEAARGLRARYRFRAVVVTLGADGCIFHDDAHLEHVETTAATVYDVTGAGDTFMAALVTSMVQGQDLSIACRSANIAAGLAVSHHGTYVLGDDEWQDAIEASLGWRAKCLTLDEASDRASRKRRQGKNIVVANGCFDLLHYGHLHLLAEAKSYGDVLFVACNTDASVRALKGEKRPVIPQTQRLEAIARFADVDYVVPFEGNVDTVVRAIRPHVLVKGAEYTGTKVPGTDLMAEHGGVVRFASMAPGYSTTAIVRRPD